MVKLIVTDIDDTLAPAGTTDLNPEYFEVFEELIGKGVRIAVATGRHIISVKKTFAPIMDKIDVLCQNGGVILCKGEETVVNPIPTELVEGVVQELYKYQDKNVDVAILTATDCYVPFLNTGMSDLLTNSFKYELTPLGRWDHLPELDYSMLTIYHPTDIMQFLKESSLQEKWGDKLCFASTGTIWVDAFLPGSDKGSSLLRLCGKLGIDPADTISFGDNINDITLIKNAGIGYAVENARPELKAAADRVIPGYKDNGVLEELRKIAREL